MAVSETFSYSPDDGGILERTVRSSGGKTYANGTRGMVVIPPHDGAVVRVDVDGETVWPEEEDDRGGALGQISSLLSMMDDDQQPDEDADKNPYSSGPDVSW